jgi:hypothetical protein
MKIDQICRENVKTCHGTEYILIDNFFDPEIFDNEHKKFLLDYFIINDKLQNILSLSGHPLVDLMHQFENKILTAINNVWHENCKEIKAAASLMPAENTLPLHHDAHWETVPIRGILYLNDVCGTTFHSDFYGNDPIDIGGKPNQLLLFKVSNKSFHSVGLNKKEKNDRFSISIMFDEVIS